jgi:hypothetical protein
MSEDLSKDDLKRIELDVKHNKIIEYLRLKDELSFNVGDVLICLRIYKSDTGSSLESWRPVTISHSSSIPKRYKVVYRNEQGVCWIKQLKADGSGFCEDISCLASIDLSHRKMVVDPDYADHIMLDQNNQFVFSEAYENEKSAKNKAKVHNKTISVNTEKLEDIEKFFSSKKSGDRFWYSREYSVLKKSNISNIEYELKSVKKDRDLTGRQVTTVRYVSVVSSSLANYTYNTRIVDFSGSFILTDKKPLSYEDLI